MLSRVAAILPVILLASPLASGAGEREPGLLVRFYQIGHGMHAIPELVPGQLPNAVKTIPTLELRTERGDFAPFEGNFYTEVEGFVSIKAAGTYTFRLLSDDGSMLWIDDRLVVNHDGPHGAVPKDGEIELTAGDHTLRVAHFESGGEEHLELQWRPPGAEADKFTLIPAAALSHDKHSRETSPGDKRIIPPLRRGLPGDGTPVAGMHPAFTPDETNMPSESELQRALGLNKFAMPVEDISFWIDGQLKSLADLRWGTGRRFSPSALVIAPGGECVHRVFYDVRYDVRFESMCVLRYATFPSAVREIYGFPATGDIVFDLGTEGAPKLARFVPVDNFPFEMFGVRAMTNGFEIEFTKPLDPRCGWDSETYYVEQWPFRTASDEATERRSDEGSVAAGAPAGRRTQEDTAQGAVAHGDAHPPRRDGVRYPVKSASVSADRKRVFLEIPDLKESHVVYIRLLPPCYSEDGERPWSTEAWYTLNVIPQDRHGEVLTPPEPEPQNFLTADEQAGGCKLLFDGQTTAGWRGYRKDHMPDGWQVKDQCLVRVGPGSDIITEDQWADFELQIEWRVCAAGNSGIFYRVNEEFDWPFFTGPEFQVLDNAEHADGRSPLTSAGSNYALHAPVRDVTAPVGFFNQVRIVCNGPHVEHWLNGERIVKYELWNDEWKQMVADTKFKAWPNYGLMQKGHIVLQDHGDMVWYRNIKIRALGTK